MAQTLVAARPVAARNSALIGSFMFAHFTHHVSNSMLTPLLPVIRDSFLLSYTQAGLLISAFSLSQGLSQAPIGALADRVGSRTVIAVGLLATGVCSLLIGLSGEYWQLLLFLVALGIIAGTYHAPAASLLAKAIPSERLGTALGIHTVGGNLSFFATPLVAGGLVLATQTWRTPYIVFAVIPALAGILLWLTVPPSVQEDTSQSNRAGFFGEIRSVLRVVGPLLSLAVVFQMLYAAMVAFLALFFTDVHGLNAPTAALLVSTPFIAGLVGSPLGGMLSDRMGRKPVIVFSLVALGPLLLLLTHAPTWALLPILLAMGLAASMRMPVMEGLLLDRAPADRRATVLGAYYFLGQELGGVAAPVLGVLAAWMGIGAAFGGIALVAALISAVVLLVQHRL